MRDCRAVEITQARRYSRTGSLAAELWDASQKT